MLPSVVNPRSTPSRRPSNTRIHTHFRIKARLTHSFQSSCTHLFPAGRQVIPTKALIHSSKNDGGYTPLRPIMTIMTIMTTMVIFQRSHPCHAQPQLPPLPPPAPPGPSPKPSPTSANSSNKPNPPPPNHHPPRQTRRRRCLRRGMGTQNQTQRLFRRVSLEFSSARFRHCDRAR